MKVGVLNVGSTTLKAALIDSQTGHSEAEFLVDRIGQPEGDAADHAAAVQAIAEEFRHHTIEAIGHRVVHGGTSFSQATVVNEDTLAQLAQLDTFAPLHNPPARRVIEIIHRSMQELPAVMVFDTAYFASLPRAAAQYGIANEYFVEHGIRRYGAHGTSHQYVVNRLRTIAPECQRIISLHLGGGCSATASLEGVAVETSMGLTPLEGLVMATRSGDIDPSVVFALMDRFDLNTKQANDQLQRTGGLVGLCGDSDVRTILQRRADGDALAENAINVFVHRIRKYIGAYMAVLGGVDAILFTAGIGENAAPIRSLVAAGLESFGIMVDAQLNAAASNSREHRISPASSPVQVWVVPTNEALAIAQQTEQALRG